MACGVCLWQSNTPHAPMVMGGAHAPVGVQDAAAASRVPVGPPQRLQHAQPRPAPAPVRPVPVGSAPHSLVRGGGPPAARAGHGVHGPLDDGALHAHVDGARRVHVRQAAPVHAPARLRPGRVGAAPPAGRCEGVASGRGEGGTGAVGAEEGGRVLLEEDRLD